MFYHKTLLPRASGGGAEQSEAEGVLLFFTIAYCPLPIAFFSERPPPSAAQPPPPEARGRRKDLKYEPSDRI